MPNDPIATQLNAMQQQFGVFQLVLAQLLARDNPARIVVLPQSQSQGHSHMASPPSQPPQLVVSDVSKRLDNLERMMAENRNAQPQAQPSSTLILTPLNTNIIQEPYPSRFKMPQFETYDGTKDPDDHLHAFCFVMQAQNASDALMYKISPSTLRGNAGLGTIVYSRTQSVVQREGESLKNYMNKFNNAVLEIGSFKQAVGLVAIIQGLKHERPTLSKEVRPPMWRDESCSIQVKYQSSEETHSSEKALVRGREVVSNQRRGAKAFAGKVSYPKDYHPLPSIDKLVEAASGNERLSLLHAYSGYHQVHMAPQDEVKTIFYASDEIYCYVMRPFGLKNARATYQKKVTIVFRAQIDRNLEVYVDDIVVKSLKVEDHLTNLRKTFDNLRKHNMKLNPAKCVFRVESGKFLGFLVFIKGIEVNPEEIKAIEEMKLPKSIKDVQCLIGRVTARHRFISKAADRCLPFFKVLRSAAQKDKARKLKKFEWTSKCQTSFDKLKAYLNWPPLLTKAEEGEILDFYLRISDTAMSLRSSIRAQALADFVVECTSNQGNTNFEVKLWILYVDGESNNKGLGAGAVLIGLENFRSEHALKFNFEATNNMAKYAALLLGLHLVAELKVRSLQLEVMEVSIDLETPSWTDPIKAYLRDGTVLIDKQEEMWRKVSRYTLLDRMLYKRSYSLPLLHCLTPYEAEYALHEVHEGVCGSHIRARTLAHKVLDQGYYWPNMQEDAKEYVQKCQFFAHLTHQPTEELTNLVAPWPFAQWGIDLLGPFVKVYHLEMNGMVKSVGNVILEGIKPMLDQLKAKWVDELNNVLWAYQTTNQMATVILVKAGVPSLKVSHFNPARNDLLLWENLDLLDEVCEQARLQTMAYK
ncbi:hypothetical protein SLEP1_g24854 [Rubroshorea leprosula]|uniref:Uncharacterized protein n=1 Tax=Rubroshorea leprosula TaxID=152421 RepID=A0AAV5JQQ5_9ROSI|nr:hypothetical protein SLEP1_g24854 [Rubroshorea leprosula]